MGKGKTFWQCSGCGHKELKWSGSCSVCREWNTLVEEIEIVQSESRFAAPKGESRPRPLQEIKELSFDRVTTSMVEFDRVLGGGVVVGSYILVGGEPGIGKSTLLLQISEVLAKKGKKVLYVCGEESSEQTSLRARRLNISHEGVYLFSETLFSRIKEEVDRLKPDILIVDSIQVIYKKELSSAPGSVSQVREVAGEFMHLSKGMGITTFLVGHVTKSGEIAGPRVLEHIVDTVLEFEGDLRQGYRLLRSIKNRFGSTDEIAFFHMEGDGLKEVKNPSEIFLQERVREIPGAVVVPTLEGSRAILTEVQALVAPSSFATSTRKSTGIDQNRLSLLLAVLEKRMGYQLYNSDIFVSLAGGIKVHEPAIDLGVLLAITSSFCNRPIDPDLVVLGEVGLGGEIRSVSRVELRMKEAIHMGFQSCLLPKKSMEGLPSSLKSKIKIEGVERVEQAIEMLLG